MNEESTNGIKVSSKAGQAGDSLLPRCFLSVEESDSHEGKASYRLVILKRAFPPSTVKTIVRIAVKCIVLTIVDSHVFKYGSLKAFFNR